MHFQNCGSVGNRNRDLMVSSQQGFKILSSFVSCFQRYGSTITEKSLTISVLPLPVFLYFFPIFPSHFYIISTLVYPSGSGSSSRSFSLHFCDQRFLGHPFLLSSSYVHNILTCSLACKFFISFTPTSKLTKS